MSGHTEGPWEASPLGDVIAGTDERGLDIVVGAAGQASPLRSDTYRVIRGRDAVRANNRMFAAAPDLLAELREATRLMVDQQADEYGPRENWPAREQIERQERAIAKAEGAEP